MKQNRQYIKFLTQILSYKSLEYKKTTPEKDNLVQTFIIIIYYKQEQSGRFIAESGAMKIKNRKQLLTKDLS